MGKLRRRSSDRLKLSLEDRDTLTNCEACRGTGKLIIESPNGTYRQKTCTWCEGVGGVPRDVAKAYKRWDRLAKYYMSKGLCPSAPKDPKKKKSIPPPPKSKKKV